MMGDALAAETGRHTLPADVGVHSIEAGQPAVAQSCKQYCCPVDKDGEQVVLEGQPPPSHTAVHAPSGKSEFSMQLNPALQPATQSLPVPSSKLLELEQAASSNRVLLEGKRRVPAFSIASRAPLETASPEAQQLP